MNKAMKNYVAEQKTALKELEGKTIKTVTTHYKGEHATITCTDGTTIQIYPDAFGIPLRVKKCQ